MTGTANCVLKIPQTLKYFEYFGSKFIKKRGPARQMIFVRSFFSNTLL